MNALYFANIVFFAIIIWLTIKVWREQSAVSVGVYFGLVFLFFTVPKYVFVRFIGSGAFDLRIVFHHSSFKSIDTGFLLIEVFLCLLLTAYCIAHKYSRSRFFPDSSSQVHPIVVQQNLSYLILLPAAIAGFAFVVAYLNLGSSENLFQKVKLLNEDAGGGLVQYLMFKSAQFIKLIFYVYLVAVVSGHWQRKSFSIAATVSLILSLMLYFFVSQRSGIFLILLDTLICFAAAKKVNWKYLAIGLALFLVANVVLLAGRLGTFELGVILESLFLRRYFLDVEKISLIFDFVDQQCIGSFRILDIFFFCSEYIYLGENIHLFVGEEIFGLPGLGIPPNAVGETILRFGPLAIFFIAPLIGIVLYRLEHRVLRARNPLHKVALIIVIVRAIYFLSSSDFSGMILRTGFDLTVLYTGWYLYRLTGHVRKVNTRGRNVVQTGRGRA